MVNKSNTNSISYLKTSWNHTWALCKHYTHRRKFPRIRRIAPMKTVISRQPAKNNDSSVPSFSRILPIIITRSISNRAKRVKYSFEKQFSLFWKSTQLPSVNSPGAEVFLVRSLALLYTHIDTARAYRVQRNREGGGGREKYGLPYITFDPCSGSVVACSVIDLL